MKFDIFLQEVDKFCKRRTLASKNLEILCTAAWDIFEQIDADKVIYPPIDLLYQFQQALIKLQAKIVESNNFYEQLNAVLTKTTQLKSAALQCLWGEIGRTLELADQTEDSEQRYEFYNDALLLANKVPYSELQPEHMQLIGNLYCFDGDSKLTTNLVDAVKSYILAYEFFYKILQNENNPSSIFYYLTLSIESLLEKVQSNSDITVRANTKYLLEKYLNVFPGHIDYGQRYLNLCKTRHFLFTSGPAGEQINTSKVQLKP